MTNERNMHHFHLELTPTQYQLLTTQAKQCGLSKRAYIVRLLEGNPVRTRPSQEIKDLRTEIHHIANNINQIARSVNAGIAKAEVRETLKLIPAKAILRRDVYYTYAYKNCEKNDISTSIAKAPKEPAVIPGSFASPETIAHIAVQKFAMYVPLYRQEQEWARLGLKPSRQIISN